MRGKVKSFVEEKKFGFIDGNDGQSYFVHIKDVNGADRLCQGQEVDFEPVPTPKGLSAKKVRAGRAPEPIYVDPHEFIMTKADNVKGFEVVKVVWRKVYAESNNPNLAKDVLKRDAIKRGANAIINLELVKYSKSELCSNYQYTMHRYYGHAVVVKRVDYTTDPEKIAKSKAEMEKLAQSKPLNRESAAGSTALVKPSLWIFIPKLLFSWFKTIMKILFMMTFYGTGRLLGVNKEKLVEILKALTKKPKTPAAEQSDTLTFGDNKV